MRRATLFFLFAAATVYPAQAATDEQPSSSSSQVISVFGAICLDHLGDSTAQMAAARGEPWHFVADGRTDDGELRFRSGIGALGVKEANKFCALTAAVDQGVDLANFQAALHDSLSFEPGTPLEESDSVYWLIAANDSNEQFVIALKVSNRTGRNLATLTVQQRMSLTR